MILTPSFSLILKLHLTNLPIPVQVIARFRVDIDSGSFEGI
jgi:hypothetical protein